MFDETRKSMMMPILVPFAFLDLRLATFSIAASQARVSHGDSKSKEDLERTSAEPADLPEASSRP